MLQGIEFLLAPFEADPQLAFLASLDVAKGGVAAVITEDSDLVAYGCPRTLFKLTRCSSLAQSQAGARRDSSGCGHSSAAADAEQGWLGYDALAG